METHTPRPKIYIDVTQLIHWPKGLTGIPRVMHELAVRFHDNRSDVVFVSWVKSLKCYCEIDYAASVLRRGNGIVYIGKGQTASDAPLTESAAEEPGTASRRTIKSSATHAAKRLIQASGRIDGRVPDKIFEMAANKKAQGYKKIQLEKDDIVFIGWGEWWDDNFLVMLEESHARGAKISTVIHDVGPMITPHLSGHSSDSLTAYCRRIVPICSLVFVNSQFTKSALVQWMREEALVVPPITVFTLGDDFKHEKEVEPQDPVFRNSKLKGGDYAMTVGTVELKKNHIFLYYVYYLARQRGIDLPKMVIVGRKGWGTETNITIMQSDPALRDKFVFLFDTSDEELSWLYNHSMFSVFPSFYEGWGIPVAESLFYGVPSISSNASSLGEVGGDLVTRFSPASTDECLAQMQRLLDPTELALARKKAATYKPATWDITYQQVIDGYIKQGVLADD